mmetsp:Transcript_57273/g.107693  ORF Transcript_57273/g.107693 Transcript_57273/m.107693 type:complete len:92 (+) Transcript_57273:1745-2020(+)
MRGVAGVQRELLLPEAYDRHQPQASVTASAQTSLAISGLRLQAQAQPAKAPRDEQQSLQAAQFPHGQDLLLWQNGAALPATPQRACWLVRT